MQQTVIQPGSLHLDALGDDKSPLELARRNTAVEKDASVTIVSLAPTYYQLVIFQCNLQVIHRKTGHREGNAQRNRA